MDYELTETQEEIKKLAYQVAVRDFKPVREKHDLDGTFPWECVKKMAAADLFGVYLPEVYGGLGGGLRREAALGTLPASAVGVGQVVIGGPSEPSFANKAALHDFSVLLSLSCRRGVIEHQQAQ